MTQGEPPLRPMTIGTRSLPVLRMNSARFSEPYRRSPRSSSSSTGIRRRPMTASRPHSASESLPPAVIASSERERSWSSWSRASTSYLGSHVRGRIFQTSSPTSRRQSGPRLATSHLRCTLGPVVLIEVHRLGQPRVHPKLLSYPGDELLVVLHREAAVLRAEGLGVLGQTMDLEVVGRLLSGPLEQADE